MKRKSLLFFLLIALLVPLAMNGQQTAVLNDGTTTMSYVPFYGLYADYGAKGQFIIPATDLANKGITSGCQISKLKFFSNATSSGTFFGTSVKVEVGEVSYTTFSSSAFVTSGLTTVLSGTSLSRSSDGTMVVSFSSNYTYNGGNLLISIGGYGSGCPSTTWLGISSTNAGVYGYNSSNSATIPTSTRGTTSYAPKTEITYIPNTPYITLNPTAATVFTGFTQTLTATYGNVSGTPTISYISSNTSVATVSGSGTTATVTGVSTGRATITATMTYEGRDYTATCEVTVVEPSYCTPSYSYTGTNYGMFINGFSTEDGETNISTSSNGLSTGGYGDYYNSYSASAEAGQTIGFTVTPGGTVNPMKYGMWIDWNKDYDFDDAGENVAIQSSAIQTNWTGIISIPATALPGSYRIRIEGMYSGDIDLTPCINGTYGEAEDYQLIVLAASSCPKPSNLQLTALGDEVTATWSGDATSYNIDINGIVTPNVTSPYVFTGTLSTEYTIKVQANCDNETSDWTNAKSVTTDACMAEEQCAITITLTDAYGDGGGSMYVVDANTEAILAELILSGSASQEFQVYACDGTEVDFYFYATDSYAYENGYVITDSNGEVIAEHVGCTSSSSCSAPTDGVIASYTMNCSCSAPHELSAEVTGNTANLSWIGAQENYNVQYGKVVFFEDFEGGSLPTGWTTIDNNNDGHDWEYNVGQSHSGTGVMTSYSSIGSNDSGWEDITPDNWLITPQLDLQGIMSVWARSQQTEASYYEEHFAIYLSTTGTNVSDFTITLVPETVTTYNGMVEYTADLSSYAGQQGYIAIRHFNCYGQFRMNIDDFGIYDMQTTTANASTVTINNLEANSDYVWQVQGVDCDGNGGTTDWSASASFTTGEFYVKDIIAHGGTPQNGGYFLISSPIATADNPTNPVDVDNMIDNTVVNGRYTYDLFRFDQNPSDGKEWRNYRNNDGGHFNLEIGKGYLYANANTVKLVFTGTAFTTTDGKYDVALDYTEGAEFAGWNLVGNPFAMPAYFEDNNDFYTMNENGSEIVLVGDDEDDRSIEAMEGVFVIAESDSESVTFTTTKPANNGKSVTLNLSNGNNVIDRAIVRFGQSRQLPKFQLNRNSTKLYFPQDGRDYAVVCTEEMGETPVNFKAEDNGTYTLNFSSVNVEFGYLHLIDNMTGKDIDLLKTSSYSFEARTTDYANRFKLVFATGNATDNFAYFSNGSFVINNDGAATLQVIDITGRIIKSESINGCANVNVNAAPGVYMLRLINGDNVKVQKVVVK